MGTFVSTLGERFGLDPQGVVAEKRLLVAGVLAGVAATAGATWWYSRRRVSGVGPELRPVGTLSEIWVHPVKSCRGQRVQSAQCTPDGLLSNGVYDRHFLVLTETNTFVTLKQEPTLALIQPQLSADGASLVLEAPGVDPLTVTLRDIADNDVVSFKLWKLDTDGLHCGQEAQDWLSSFLKKPGTKLVFFKAGSTHIRSPAQDRQWGHKFRPADKLFGFQDLATLMLLTEASLEDLNSRLQTPVTMRNLRPNLVVAGARPYEEDEWKYIKIGDTVNLRRTHGCGRCLLTTVDPETGVPNKDQEPLATLRKYRKLPTSDPDCKTIVGAPVCGSNLMCDSYGTINVGDTVYAAM